MKYDFYSDAGHGWLKVSIEELEKLGISDKITGCSYMRNKWAYLEEDADVSTFCNAKKIDQLAPFIREHSCNTSKIRSYDSFDYAQFLALKVAINRYDSEPVLRKWVNRRLDAKSGGSYFANKEKHDHLSYNAKTWFYNIAKEIQKEALTALLEWQAYLIAAKLPEDHKVVIEAQEEKEVLTA